MPDVIEKRKYFNYIFKKYMTTYIRKISHFILIFVIRI